jgi:hypothetical protein
VVARNSRDGFFGLKTIFTWKTHYRAHTNHPKPSNNLKIT